MLSIQTFIATVQAHARLEERVEDLQGSETTEAEPTWVDYGFVLALTAVAAVCALTAPGIAFVARLGQLTNSF